MKYDARKIITEAVGDNGGIAMLGSERFPADMNLKTFLNTAAEAAGKNQFAGCKGVLALFTPEDTKRPMQLMSGEVEGGNFVMTFSGSQEGFVPFGMLIQLIAKEINPGFNGSTALEAFDSIPDSMGVVFATDDGRFLEPARLDMKKADGGEGFVMLLDVMMEETEGPVGGLKKAEYSSSTDTALGFVKALEQLKSGGRDIMKMQAVCVEEGPDGKPVRLYSVQPGETSGRHMLMWLSPLFGRDDEGNEFGDPEYAKEAWTFQQLVDSMKTSMERKGMKNADLFFKSRKYGVFGVDRIEFERGKPPMIVLGEWGRVDEKRNARTEKRVFEARRQQERADA